jgi:hypothetical protein
MRSRQTPEASPSVEFLVHAGFTLVMGVVGAVVGLVLTTVILLKLHADSGGDRWWGPGILIGGGIGAVDGIVAGYLKDLARRSHAGARFVFASLCAVTAAYLGGLVTYPVADLPYYDFLPKVAGLPRMCTATAALALVTGFVAAHASFPGRYERLDWS